ncbi:MULTISPECIES: Rieske (2Fe-2S) protein [Paraburkholderia]|jgi:3-phenylpropionate/trans-cinnamate dioxygenase ferredoxin subunit|uniref:Rieske 2Fe-2S domain-containing protein n=1 Tax=Paraburkholderia madseniana TaxID=2599607 RepID=A0A6N6W1T4_9BURK|nr:MULTISPECIES: Rieske 2Fe-2S domain-containing protein [Paraburkholderia]KAE8754607.1 Rieske 2Fe-2S domain-containing protein [Paraburkholderia madseniana]MCX4171595.1 nitrite reductase (NAD(P)H) small subunit [Paraburkholderia madseniana]MDQ6459605.1 nitrite reductase (NAD(P)H) small subunit [Paraburkholderia madseniana]NPT66151.1 Rieske 2Fe-2S domain-containing protein [Paraburkholderia madseniana]
MSRQIPVGVVDELAPGQRKLAFVDGRSIVLFNIDGTIHAIDNACPHNGASVASGQLEGCVLRCPAHGLRFDLRTGCMPGAGGLSLTTFPVRVVDGKLVVSLEDPVTSSVQAPVCNSAP